MDNDTQPAVPAVRSNDNVLPVPNPGEDGIKLSQRFADAVTGGMGSWKFIIGQAALITAWIGVNTAALATPWDPNLTLLNLALSCESAFAGAFILMSQNRRAEKDRLMAQNDYQIDLEAERQIRDMNRKLDILLALIPPETLKAMMEALPPAPAEAQVSVNDNGTAARPAAKLAP